jgi:hypothetical protein
MSGVIDIQVTEITPSLEAILRGQGIPPGTELKSQVVETAKTALQLFVTLARPLALMSGIDRSKFEPIYRGIGLNAEPAPIRNVYEQSHRLAVFAATVGPDIVQKISDLFTKGEFALGSLLDSAASNGTDLISHVLEKKYLEDLNRIGQAFNDTTVMAYSPGYCGWHISAQKALFEYLNPAQIGISLRDSFLMEPLKSISGVLVAGPREIHSFEAIYPFCKECKPRPCQDRMKSIKAD